VTEARFLPNAPTQYRPPDSRLQSNADFARPHHSLVCISRCQSRHRQHLIKNSSASPNSTLVHWCVTDIGYYIIRRLVWSSSFDFHFSAVLCCVFLLLYGPNQNNACICNPSAFIPGPLSVCLSVRLNVSSQKLRNLLPSNLILLIKIYRAKLLWYKPDIKAIEDRPSIKLKSALSFQIREVAGLNLGPETSYPGTGACGILSSFRKIPGWYLRLGLDRFHPHPFQFIIHVLSLHSTLHILSYWKRH
jgi:hypothetical protein